MGAPSGNKFWKIRSSHGRKPIFEKPKDLWAACVEYFEWVDQNPLMETELVKFQGVAKSVLVPKMRAMTLGGLCVFLGIAENTWSNYRNKDEADELDDDGETFIEVCTQVELIIRTQKFEGGAAGFFNPNIIARDLGLVDKKDHTGRFKTAGLVSKVDKDMSDNDASQIYADFLREDDES